MEYKVETNDKPTVFNKDATLGFLLSEIALPVAIGFLGITAPLTLPIAAAVGAAGALLGGIIGRARMSRELEEGKVVKEPSALNKESAIGGILGVFAGAVAAGLGAVALGAAAPVVTTALLVGALVGAASGAIIGGVKGKNGMQREFDAASQAQEQQDKLLAVARARQLEQVANGTVPDNNTPAQNALPPGVDNQNMLPPGTEFKQLPPGNPDITVSAIPDRKDGLATLPPETLVIPPAQQPSENLAVASTPPATTLQDSSPAAVNDTTVITPAATTPAAVTLVDSNPTNNTTIITAPAQDAPAADGEPHTHNITTNTYTTVITATPPQQPTADGATINNTLLAAADSQPANTQLTSQPQTTLVAASDTPPAPVQETASDSQKPVIRITISGDGAQPTVISGQPDGGEKSFTAALLNERDQTQQTAPMAPEKKGPTTSYAANVDAQRQQPGAQVNAV